MGQGSGQVVSERGLDGQERKSTLASAPPPLWPGNFFVIVTMRSFSNIALSGPTMATPSRSCGQHEAWLGWSRAAQGFMLQPPWKLAGGSFNECNTRACGEKEIAGMYKGSTGVMSGEGRSRLSLKGCLRWSCACGWGGKSNCVDLRIVSGTPNLEKVHKAFWSVAPHRQH